MHQNILTYQNIETEQKEWKPTDANYETTSVADMVRVSALEAYHDERAAFFAEREQN